MEFTRLADVEVVETANDTDKVLIEQNGEIKRVPKTEVGGGGGGNVLIIDLTVDFDTEAISGTANMTLTEAIAAHNNCELTGICIYFPNPEAPVPIKMLPPAYGLDYSSILGSECYVIMCEMLGELFWTESGFSMEPPM